MTSPLLSEKAFSGSAMSSATVHVSDARKYFDAKRLTDAVTSTSSKSHGNSRSDLEFVSYSPPSLPDHLLQKLRFFSCVCHFDQFAIPSLIGAYH